MKDFQNNIVYNKAFDFSLEIIELYKFLSTSKKEYVISKQLLRSGTSIGANISEALFAQSKKDFISKMHISLKESSESYYWINLLSKSNQIDDALENQLLTSLDEIIRILKSIICTSKDTLTK